MTREAEPAGGFLAIWSDVASADETDYLHWLTREHITERLGVEGFLTARVYRALAPGVRRYFIHYELQTPEVVSGPGYLARLNEPTPWSRRIMPLLGNFARGGGRVAARAGKGTGGVRAAIRLPAAPASDALQVVKDMAAADRIAAVTLLVTDADRTAITTTEKAMRAHDESFAALLVVDGLDEAAVVDAATAAGFTAEGQLYKLVFDQG